MIPPRLWHGVQNIGPEPAILINAVDHAYRYENPDHWRVPADSPTVPYLFSQIRQAEIVLETCRQRTIAESCLASDVSALTGAPAVGPTSAAPQAQTTSSAISGGAHFSSRLMSQSGETLPSPFLALNGNDEPLSGHSEFELPAGKA